MIELFYPRQICCLIWCGETKKAVRCFHASYSQTSLDVESCVHNLSSRLVTGQKLQRFTNSPSGWRLSQSQLAKQNVNRGQVSESKIQFLYHLFFKQFNSKFDFRQKRIEFNIGKPKFKQPINWKRILSCFFFFPDFLKIRIFPEFMKFGWQHVSACCPNLVVDWIGFTIGYGVSTARNASNRNDQNLLNNKLRTAHFYFSSTPCDGSIQCQK